MDFSNMKSIEINIQRNDASPKNNLNRKDTLAALSVNTQNQRSTKLNNLNLLE
tara:strand:- start:2377 stop:2535 length:159 start_codon:yes stop_codon:yes gene_type:complete